MELHAVLKELVDAHGPGVLGDPAVFRGVLDDYLDESAATTGEINLLVDAVRFGALPSLVTMIDSGAEPERAVVEAGGRLARERGGEDTRAGSWAVAVLGFALRKVPEPVLARYPSPSNASTRPPGAAPSAAPPTPGGTYQRAATQWPAPTSGGAPTAVPGTPPATNLPAPGLPPTGLPQSGQNPPMGVPAPGGGSAQSGWPPPGNKSGGSSKRPIALIAAVAVVLVLVVGGMVGFLATRGGDDDPKDDAGNGETSDAPEEVDTSAEAVTERYAALGGAVAAQASECVAAEAGGDDVMEALDCTLPAGTLRLVTYSTATALETARNRSIDQREGTIQEVTGDSAFYSFDPANSFDPASSQSPEPAQVYWDSYQALQSALITSGAPNPDDIAAAAETVTAAFDATNPTVSVPTEPTNQELIDFVNSLDPKIVETCERVPSYSPEMLQEHQCSFKGYSVFAGRFDRIQRLKQARQEATSSQAQSDVYPADDNIYDDVNANNAQDESEPTIGAVRGYTLESDTGSSAVLYIDHGVCRCYLELWHVKDAGEEPIDPEVMADDIF
ncbi:MAG TPA: hypothetical protein VD859_01635 [Nocardioides sp.]|nr:hypothetical protein [Nocardioides sp.]